MSAGSWFASFAVGALLRRADIGTFAAVIWAGSKERKALQKKAKIGLLPNMEQNVKIKLIPPMDGRGQGLRQNVIRQQETKMVLGVILESLWICAQHQKYDRTGLWET